MRASAPRALCRRSRVFSYRYFYNCVINPLTIRENLFYYLHAETQPDRIEIRLRQIGCKAISGFIYALPGHTPCFDITNINKKSIRQPGIHTIIDPEQIFFHLTGASCPNSVEQTRNPGRTTGTNTAKGALHRHLSPSRIESNGYWHLSAICSIQRAFATTAAWPPEILLIN